MAMDTQSQIDMLANQAKLKLEAQKKQAAKEAVEQQENEQPKDIYADIRDEVEYDLPENVDIQHANVNYGDEDYHIEHDVEAYEMDTDFNAAPLWEGGPSVGQVEIWKKQYSHDKVFHTMVLDRHFVFRTLNRFEYKQIVAIDNIDALYREEIICKTCVLFPFNYDFKTMAAEESGYPSTLAQIIMENSGFTKDYALQVL